VWANGFAVTTIAKVLGLGEKRPQELREADLEVAG
jgi:hypothetical protein